MASNKQENGESENSGRSRSYDAVVPPGLVRVGNEFKSLLDVLYSGKEKAPPLMIVGDRGVGKSLFVKTFERRYSEAYPDRKVIRRNIAAIPETLMESEVFGHAKGSFTGAIRDKKGLIEEADLLVLEEIGELPGYVQAKLLTFIEDGRYYRVGDTTERMANANIQIVATTNRLKKDFRADFLDRFFRFTVPPLHQRRLDVLYYLHFFGSGLLQELRPWEIMNLLAHNWPGNVREVERVAQEIKWRCSYHADDSLRPQLPVTSLISSTQTDYEWDFCHRFCQSLSMDGIDVKLLERALNVYGLGIMGDNQKKPFQKRQEWPMVDATCQLIEKGISFFQSLFMCHLSADTNLFEAHKTGKFAIPFFQPFQYIENPGPRHEKMVRDIMRWTSGSEPDPGIPFPGVDGDYADFIQKAMHGTHQDPMATARSSNGDKDNPFTGKNEKAMLENYYRWLLDTTHGNKSKAAKLAGLETSTFAKKLKRMKILENVGDSE